VRILPGESPSPYRDLLSMTDLRVHHLVTDLRSRFFNLSTWLTAIAGAAVLLLIFHLVSARSGGSRRFAHR
jgi:hypothetical protein